MGLTILLTLLLMALLWLLVWSATVTLPYGKLIQNFPKDVQERLEPRIKNLPMSPKRAAGRVILILLVLSMIGVLIWGGLDGVRRGYGFGRLFLRFFIMGAGVKAFDIIGLDYYLLAKSHFFQRYFPETEGCAGWKDFGFNRKEQLKQIVMIPIFSAVFAWIFVLLG